MKDCVRATAVIGAQNFSGVIYSQHVKAPDARPTEKDWQYAAVALREVAQFAQELGVNIGLEPVNRYEMYLVNTCAQARRLKAMIGTNNVKIHLDTYHMNIEEKSFYEATKLAGDDLIHVHLCENDRGIPGAGSVEAITCVAGYMPVYLAVQNALYVLELAQRTDIPVYAGRTAPIIKPPKSLQRTHGEDGLGDIGLPIGGRIPATGNGVEKVVDLIRDNPGELTLITLGSLTNLAAALLFEPAVASLVKKCVMMGGSANGIGNVTPIAEANIWQDADAAHIVFQSGMPIIMIGYDATYALGVFNRDDMALIRSYGDLAAFSMDIHRVSLEQGIQKGKGGFALPDPLTMAVAIDPGLATTNFYHVTVETLPGLTEGQTVVDRRGLPHIEPNAEVVVDVNREKFLTLLEMTLTASHNKRLRGRC